MGKRVIAADFETALINHVYEDIGHTGLAPPPVCLSYQEVGKEACLVAGEDMLIFNDWVLDDNVILIFQNGPVDLLVAVKHLGLPIEKVFQKYNKGLIKDTQIRETLLCLANGEAVRNPGKRYDLGSMVLKYLDKDISSTKSGDVWRLKYYDLLNIPLEDWPQEAIDYPLDDASHTLKVFAHQHKHKALFQANELKQTRAAWDLHLISAKSPKVNKENVEAFIAAQEKVLDAACAPLIAKGILKPNPNKHKAFPKGDERRFGYSMDTKIMKQLVQSDYTRQGKVVPATEGGDISIAGEVLLGCKNKILRNYGEAAFEKKMMESFAPAVRKALESPTQSVSPRYGVIKKTGRTGCTKPNMQNVSKAPGARECYEAPEGKVFVSIDYSSMEVFTLAQTMYNLYGIRDLLDVVNDNDPHLIIAAKTMGISREEAEALKAAKDPLFTKYRNFGKVQNFGYGGGMGAGTTLGTMDQPMIELLQELYPGQNLVTVVKDSIADWKRQWNLVNHFNKMGRLCQDGKKPTYTCPTTGRIKALNSYCQLCNMHFQPLAADALKEALKLIQESCWIEGRFLNYHGVELQIEIHDEVVMAGPPETLDKWVPLVQAMMVEGAQKVLPDCKIKTEAGVCGKFWSKQELSVEEYMEKYVHT